MHTEYRAECTPGKPAHQKFFKCRIFDIPAKKASDIRCPPRNTSHAHIKSCLQLLSHGAEGRVHIPGPGKNAIFLAACPCTAHQTHDIFFSLRFQSVIKSFRIANRINVAALQCRSLIIAVIIKIIWSILRFRFI